MLNAQSSWSLSGFRARDVARLLYLYRFISKTLLRRCCRAGHDDGSRADDKAKRVGVDGVIAEATTCQNKITTSVCMCVF